MTWIPVIIGLALYCKKQSPRDYVQLRYVENHDTDRVVELAATRQQALAWIAFQAFNKGAWLIYAGEEAASPRKPDQFNKDVIPWKNYELTEFIQKLATLKKDPAQKEGNLYWLTSEPVIQAVWFTEATSRCCFHYRRGERRILTAVLWYLSRFVKRRNFNIV